LRIHRLSLALIAALICLTGLAQQAPEPKTVLQQTRDRLLPDLVRLPRYTCVQSITRKYFSAPIHLRQPRCSELIAAHDARHHELSLQSWDRLRLEVAIIENGNVYSWVGAPRFEKDNMERLSGHGPLGSGDFGIFLAEIFGRAIVNFQGEEVAEGRRLLKYSYDMPIGRSSYKIKLNDAWVLTAYSGTLLLDPATADIVRLTVRTAELPQEPACLATSEVDYGRTAIHDRMILVPHETRLRTVRFDGTETLSVTTYSSCREYASKSRVLTEAPAGVAGTEAGTRLLPSVLPEGLHFEARIVTAIDSDTAWAGDPIEAVLRSKLRDDKHNVVAPAGARLHGRLVYVGHKSEPFEHFEIGLQWESIEINGRDVLLRAARYLSPSVMTARIVSRLPASAQEDSSAGIGTFIFRDDHLRLKHFDTDWVTIGPESETEHPKEN
jgi:hypothetical protein